MTTQMRPRLTREQVNTIEAIGERHQWKAWLSSRPSLVRTGATEAGAIASLWWWLGLMSEQEAMRLMEGR